MQESKVEIVSPSQRRTAVRRALNLQWLTISWNIGEGVIALLAGMPAHSVALLGFGIDSLIETASGTVVAWRLLREENGASTEHLESVEKTTRKIAGVLLLVLALYVLGDSVRRLLGYGEPAHASVVGLGITIAALLFMPLLSKAKLQAAAEIGSAALKADAAQATCCAWLALTTLLGLLLNAAFHWWWADSLAACAIVPMLVREGLEALKGEQCGCSHACNNE